MDLHNKLKTAADALDKRFGLKIPEMNAAPVLWRLTRSLGGTRELFPGFQVPAGPDYRERSQRCYTITQSAF
jgi:hypothetical protein